MAEIENVQQQLHESIYNNIFWGLSYFDSALIASESHYIS